MSDKLKFITKIAVTIICYIAILIISVNVSIFTSPVVTNEVALNQMSNSNEAFLLMDTYFKLKPVAYIALGFVTVMFIIAIISEVKKYISNSKENNKK